MTVSKEDTIWEAKLRLETAIVDNRLEAKRIAIAYLQNAQIGKKLQEQLLKLEAKDTSKKRAGA